MIMTTPDTITRKGAHFLTEPLRLVSGTHLKAEPGARLIGGVKLTPEPCGNGLWTVDLQKAGVEASGFASRGFGRKITPSHSELFLDGRPLSVSQYPKKGSFLTISGIGEPMLNEWKKPCGKLEGGFFYEDDRPKGWRGGQDVWVHGYWAWDWAPTHEKVEVFDREKGFVRCAEPYGQYHYTVGQRFCFFNIIEEVTEPGDWCLDAAGGRVWFRPFEDTDMERAELILSALDRPLILIEDAKDVTVEGFVIEASRGCGIAVKNAENVRILDCEVKNIGSRGVTVERSRNVTVERCHVHDTGDGCIAIWGGDRTTLAPGNCGVDSCHLHHAARWDRCYEPPVCLYGVGLYARDNLIHDCPHTAVLYGGNDISITGNEIYRVVTETGDAGAIYAGRDYTFRGNEVSGNFIHHVGSGVGMGTMGVYNDDALSGTVMKNNVFYRVQRAVFLGGGVDFVVEGNVFVDCSPAVEADGRGQSDHDVWRNMITNTMKQRFYNIEGKGVSGAQPPYIERYPSLAKIDAYYQADPAPHIPPSAEIVGNILCTEQKIRYTWNCEGGQFVERDNVECGREELGKYLTPRQLAVINGDAE